MSKPNEPKQPTGDGLWTQDGCWILTGATSMTQVQNPGVANGLIHTHNSALRSLKADRPTCPSDEKDMSMCCPDYMQAYVTRVVEEREALRELVAKQPCIEHTDDTRCTNWKICNADRAETACTDYEARDCGCSDFRADGCGECDPCKARAALRATEDTDG